MFWEKLSREAIKERVFKALDANRTYAKDTILGIPGTYLDTEQFYRDASFLEVAPYLKTFINNPNHIGCHTLTGDEGEDLFRGTQKLEIELIRLVSEEILGSPPKGVDGYVAPGGTEANIQALWIYRNYFQKHYGISADQVGVIFSRDSHYSFYKAANLMGIRTLVVPTDEDSRRISNSALKNKLSEARDQGLKCLVGVANMSTTLFGSVDDPDRIADALEEAKFPYQIHVDAAFGGFIYPFTEEGPRLDFSNPRISSISLDAHKMLMAPYGTGIFLIRKGWMHYTATQEAEYVQGADYTLVGSRNGAAETNRHCHTLEDLHIPYFREKKMNIVAIQADKVPQHLPQKYRLVADNFDQPRWWKIVVMPHTTGQVLGAFQDDLRKAYGSGGE